MKLDVISLDASPKGSIELDDAIFGLTPRADILHRVVRWQLAKRQAGTHSVLGKSEVSYSTKKIYRQKGTGGARHGSRKAPIFRHGGTYKGPTPRSHAHDLNKKFRALGLRHALSAKAKDKAIVILDKAELGAAKTKDLRGKLAKLKLASPVAGQSVLTGKLAGVDAEGRVLLSHDDAPAPEAWPRAIAFEQIRSGQLVVDWEELGFSSLPRQRAGRRSAAVGRK